MRYAAEGNVNTTVDLNRLSSF